MQAMLDRAVSVFEHNYRHAPLTTILLVTIGLLWSARQTASILSATHLYFIRSSKLNRYIANPSTDDPTKQTWALVTGASDGLGRGFAEELLSRKINVVLHGRNETKLNRIRDELLALFPKQQVRLVVLDAYTATGSATALDEAASSLSDLNLRILINNVAGGGTTKTLWDPLTARSHSEVDQMIGISAGFMTQITRVLLPQLQRNQPSLIINIGSGISDFATPYIEVIAGTKAYNQAFSRSLGLEMQVENHDIEVLLLQVGAVSSATSPRPTSLLVPSSRRFAKAGLDVVGCGREVVWPYWPHALQFQGLIMRFPVWLRNMMITGIAKKEWKEEQEKLKREE